MINAVRGAKPERPLAVKSKSRRLSADYFIPFDAFKVRATLAKTSTDRTA